MSATVSRQEGRLHLLVRVLHHQENRRLTVSAEVEGGPASISSRSLDGVEAEESFDFYYPYRPGTHYTFVVTLTDSLARNVAIQTLEVE